MAFSLKTVAIRDFNTLRVTFTQNPKVVSSGAANDALNSNNYVLTGPSRNYVKSVIATPGDLRSVDCTLAAPLLLGGWQLSVVNIVQDSLVALTPPIVMSFLATTQPSQTALPGGTTNDEVSGVIRKFFNPTLKGPNWDAFIKAIAAGDQVNWDNAKLAFDQLFLSAASGKYLDKRAGDEGQKRPIDVGMPDDLFRKLAISVKNKKLTEEAILEVLEVFYGVDAVRASSTSDIAEPYSFSDGDTLVLLIDEKHTVTVNFTASHFARISVSYAIEVAAEITRALKDAGSNAYAQSYTDPTTGLNHVRIYSGSLGLSSSVRVIGGKTQTVLRFPTSIFVEPFTPTVWNWDKSAVNLGYLRFTGGPFFNLDLLQVGDLVYIFGQPFVGAGISGVFPVAFVGSYYDVSNPVATKQQWFEIFDPSITVGTGTQNLFSDMMFFRPKKRTIYDQVRHVVVAQTDGTVDVTIPATTEVVVRGPGTGAYLNGSASVPVSVLERQDGVTVKVTLTTPKVFTVGDQIIVDSVIPTGNPAPLDIGTPSGDFAANIASGTTEASLMTTVSITGTFQGFEHHVHKMREGEVLIVGGQTKSGAVLTAIANPVLLEITSESVNGNGGRQQVYKWTKLATRTYTAGPRAFGSSTISSSIDSILDNRVLVTGGTTGDDITGVSKNNWDVFTYSKSPALNSQVGGTMPVARAGHAQASVATYELICGGWTTAGTPINTTYSFATDTLTWTLQGAMLRARMNHTLTPYHGVGTVLALATGGKTASAITNHCEIYDINTTTWSVVGPMTYARYDHTAVRIPDGRIIVFGGTGYDPTRSTTPVALSAVEIYDPNTKIWNRLDPMRTARTKPVAVFMPTRNAIYVTGDGSSTIEILDIGTLTWSKVIGTNPFPSTPQTFVGSVGGLLGPDTFAVIGGTLP